MTHGFTSNFRLPYTIYQTPLATLPKNNLEKNIPSAEFAERCDNQTNQQTSYTSMVTDHQTDQFISTLFVHQQTNKTGPVFNLRQLNTFVETSKLKMESSALLQLTL